MIYIIISLILIIIAFIFNKKKNIAEFKESDSTQMIDVWSLHHFNSGVIYQLIVKNMKFKNKLLYGFILAILFEIIENSKFGIKYMKITSKEFLNNKWGTYNGDNFCNSVMDIIFFIIGYYVSCYINNTYFSILILIINEFLVYLLHNWHYTIDLKEYIFNYS